jgi:hypothetical protein
VNTGGLDVGVDDGDALAELGERGTEVGGDV